MGRRRSDFLLCTLAARRSANADCGGGAGQSQRRRPLPSFSCSFRCPPSLRGLICDSDGAAAASSVADNGWPSIRPRPWSVMPVRCCLIPENEPPRTTTTVMRRRGRGEGGGHSFGPACLRAALTLPRCVANAICSKVKERERALVHDRPKMQV